MRIKKLQLKDFRRFTDLTIALGESPKKIIALVGPNGSGKSSVFDAFEEKLKDRYGGTQDLAYLSKLLYSSDNAVDVAYDRNRSITIEADGDVSSKKSFYIRTAYRYSPRIETSSIRALPELLEDSRPQSAIDTDSRLQRNHERLIG